MQLPLLLAAAGASALLGHAQGTPLVFERQETLNATASATGAASPSLNASNAFPTDIGFLGTTVAGKEPPFTVQTDVLLNSSAPNSALGPAPYERRWYATDDSSNGSAFNIWEHMGNTSPYASSKLFPDAQRFGDLPDSCEVTGLHLLHRHGARFPTSYTSEGAPLFGATIRNATNLTASGPLSFLTSWQYELGAELLVPSGRAQLFDSGVAAALRYGKLINATQANGAKPVLRTTSQSRILDSARYWSLGAFGWDAPERINMEVQIEGDGFNTSLASYDTCNNSNTIDVAGMYLEPIWLGTYLKDAISRLQPYTNLNLTAELVYGMQSLCPYETQALGFSHFCGLFTKDEWRGYDYYLSLQFAGSYGFLSPSGKAQGIGYAQELLARLMNTTVPPPVTTQNTTFSTSELYSPYNQSIYADFTHDDIIVSVLTALNYTQFADYLDPKAINSSSNFVLSQITPFSAQLAFEIISCSNSSSTSSNSSPSAGSELYLRTVLNDALVPMTADQGCTSGTPNPTLCKLADFIEYQNATAVKAANFDKACFGKNGTDFVITGPVRNGTVG